MASPWTSLTALFAAIQPDKPIKASLHRSIAENIVALAERATGAPRVQPGERAVFTSSGTWNIPAGVTAFTVTGTGGGGSLTGAGGTSSVTYDGVSASASGGPAGSDSYAPATASGGDMNIPGGNGSTHPDNIDGPNPANGRAFGAASYWGGGTLYSKATYGAGCGGNHDKGSDFGPPMGGGSGATFIKRYNVNPIVSTVSVVVGAGNGNGGNGIVIIEY